MSSAINVAPRVGNGPLRALTGLINQRILIVDDDADLTALLARLLNKAGYQCVLAGNADEAEQRLQQEQFMLMLLDIQMPGKTGLSMLPELTKRYPDMAVIVVSSYDQLETGVLSMRLGADDYIAKPVSISRLAFRIEAALSRRAFLKWENVEAGAFVRWAKTEARTEQEPGGRVKHRCPSAHGYVAMRIYATLCMAVNRFLPLRTALRPTERPLP